MTACLPMDTFCYVLRSDTTDSLEPVADRISGWRARRVVTGPALNQIGLVGVAKEDEGGTIVGGLAVTGNLPSFLQHSADRGCVFGPDLGISRQGVQKSGKKKPRAACSAGFI